MVEWPELEWTCHACGRERPDDKISVASHTLNVKGVEMTKNMRYCNDSAECKAKAAQLAKEWP